MPFDDDHPWSRYDDADDEIGRLARKIAPYLYMHRRGAYANRSLDVRDVKQDIYLLHLSEGRQGASGAVASRAVRRRGRREPQIRSLDELFGEAVSGDRHEYTGVSREDEIGFIDRVADIEETKWAIEKLRRSAYRSTVARFVADYSDDHPFNAAQRQRRVRLRKAFPELVGLFKNRFRRRANQVSQEVD